ncbi:MAG TPA: MscL family protein [Vicinamibacterales bacterium]|nr:MscL family protein [Vicinamibacterales bacterium]
MAEEHGSLSDHLTNTVERMGGAVNEFRAFLKNYNVVGMAIGIVMGAAVTKLVNSVVQSFVMPLISLALPRGEWQKAGWVLRQAVPDAVDPTKVLYPEIKILYGDMIGTGLDFIIIAILVFMFARYVLREEKVAKK